MKENKLKKGVRKALIAHSSVLRMGRCANNPFTIKYLNEMSVAAFDYAMSVHPLLHFYILTRRICTIENLTTNNF